MPGARTTIRILCVAGAVARVAMAWRQPLDHDETFTATASRLPLGRLFRYLAFHDSHPPLDYLTRIPFARAAAAAGWIRLPSLVESIVALVVLAWWLSGRGRWGVWAVMIACVGSFPLAYAGQARMYSGMMLVGVVVAMAAERWLRSNGGLHVAAMSLGVFAGLFLHVSALPLAVGLMLVPGLQRSRMAWLWRAGVAIPVVVWAGLWGPSFLHQLHGGHANWIPFTSGHEVVASLSELIGFYVSTALVTVVAIVAGLVMTGRRDPTLGRVVVCCAVLPAGLIIAAGIRFHILLPRTLAFMWWAPVLALGLLLDLAWARSTSVGMVALVMAALVILPSTWTELSDRPQPQTAALRRVTESAEPGDVVAIYPGWLSVLTRWYVDVRGPGGRPVPPARSLAVDDRVNAGATVGLGSATHVMWVRGAKPTGRAWLIRPASYPDPAPDLKRCGARDVDFGSWIVECRQLATPRAG